MYRVIHGEGAAYWRPTHSSPLAALAEARPDGAILGQDSRIIVVEKGVDHFFSAEVGLKAPLWALCQYAVMRALCPPEGIASDVANLWEKSSWFRDAMLSSDVYGEIYQGMVRQWDELVGVLDLARVSEWTPRERCQHNALVVARKCLAPNATVDDWAQAILALRRSDAGTFPVPEEVWIDLDSAFVRFIGNKIRRSFSSAPAP